MAGRSSRALSARRCCVRLARGLLTATALIWKATSARSLMVLADDASWRKVASRKAPARWSETAKRERLGSSASRQLALPLASACLHLVLDLNAGANVGSGRHATLEYALRIAASIARYATLHGLRIRLSAAGAAPLHIPAGSGELHYQAILDALAVADADGETPYAGLLEQVSRQSLPGETAVVFLRRSGVF